MKKSVNIEDATLRLDYSHRGGGIEISLDTLAKKYTGGKMTAYQNYLGGGMLGAIQSDCNIKDWRSNNVLVAQSEALKQYLHDLTNHEGDEWEEQSYEQNQNMPTSAY